MTSTLRLFCNRRMLTVLLLGFSSGVPLALTGGTLQAWMATEKVDLTVIGIFSLVALPYTLKFLWAPLMDEFTPRFLGRRRGWILITQLALILAISSMSFFSPAQTPATLAALAFLVAFASASQDIVVDAFRTELLVPAEFGAGAAMTNLGYRVAMLFSGAIAFIMADHLPWHTVYLIMAASVGVGVLTTLFLAPEPKLDPKTKKSLRTHHWKTAILEPFLEFFRRPGVADLVLFIIIYKLDVVVATFLMTPFMMELGFTKTDIGTVTKGFGLVATIIGTFAGGALLNRIGLHKALVSFGILQAVSGICFFILAKVGHHYPMMVTTIAVENFCSGMGNAAYAAFLMSLCNPRFTATQFALLTSLMALTRTLAGVPTGWMAKSLGWEAYFLISIFMGIPGLLLLFRYPRWVSKR